MTDARRTMGNFDNRLPWSNTAHVWTKSEGSPSADGRYWGFMAETEDFAPLGFFVYNMETDTIASTLTNRARPDHVSMSASGNYFVVSWDAPDGTWAYPRDLQTRFQLHASSEHSDLALDANGDDIYVSVDYSSNGGDVFIVNLRTRARTMLFPTYCDIASEFDIDAYVIQLAPDAF